MSVTSSYSNVEDARDPYDDIGVSPDAIFTRIPVAAYLDESRERIAECDRRRGHSLRVTEQGIECIRCEARWTEE